MPPLALLALLGGCTAGDGAGGTDDATPDTATEGGNDSGDAPPMAPDWTPEELAAAWAAAVAGDLPSPRPLRDRYFAMLAEGADDACPGSDQLDGANPLGCTSEQGWFFAGFSSWLVQDAGGGAEEWVLSGDFVIRDPEARDFEVGGHALHRLQAQDTFTTWRSELHGWWRLDGADGWLGDGVSAMFRTDGTVDPGGARVSIDGGLSWEGLSAYFHTLRVDPGECGPRAFSGKLEVRDPSGGWWFLAFPGDCSACAPASFAGVDQGEVCLDLDTPFDTLTTDLSQP